MARPLPTTTRHPHLYPGAAPLPAAVPAPDPSLATAQAGNFQLQRALTDGHGYTAGQHAGQRASATNCTPGSTGGLQAAAESSRPGGNQETLRALGIQARHTVSQPGDPDEQEAEHKAGQVMLSTAPAASPARHVGQQRQQVLGSTSGAAALQAAPPLLAQVLRSPGRPLDAATRAFMEPRFGYDFSQVRVHAGPAAEQSARDLGASAYTVGRDIAFAAGRFAPGTQEGRHLLAHELTHVVQQSGPAGMDGAAGAESASLPRAPITRTARTQLARKAAPSAIAGMNVSEIQASPDYIDNNFKRMTFYGAEEADIVYTDGAVLRIGLVPKWIKPPFVTVDYHTARAEFAQFDKSEKDLRFIPNVKAVPAKPGETFGQVLEKYAVPVSFAVEPASGKIVPNHVNPVTAPKLCAWLLATEAEYVKNFDAMAKGMIVILEKMKLIIELELARVTLPAGGAKKPPTPKPSMGSTALFSAEAVADELVIAAQAGTNPGARMLLAATRLSAMGGYSAATKVEVILAFFKRIAFAINKEGVIETAEYFAMKSEDAKYAFRFLKSTGEIVYGKFDVAKLDYVWTLLK